MKRFYGNFTKRTLLSLLIVHLSLLSFSATYYVSSAGNDSNTGLTAALAWKTLSKVNAATFIAGDQILFQKGDTFYGSLTVKNSGSSGSPIIFGAYGTGANPIVTGFTTVSAWTNLGSNIWESTNAVSTLSNCNMVSVNGVNTPMGRYPNIGYLTFQSHIAKTSITSSSLTGTPNWTGATAVVRTSDYTLDKSTAITSQSGSTINFTLPVYEPTNGWGFFIQNDSRTLDSSNEWYYNPSTKKIQVYSATQPTNVKVASVTNLLTISGDYVTINGIDFTGANGSGIYNQTAGIDHVTITNCNVSFSGGDGIKFRGDYSTIENNTVYYSNNDGMAVYYLKNSTVRNNVIQNSGVIPGMGNNGIGSCYGIDAYETGGTLFEYNKIINSGYIGISFYGNSVVVKNNLVDTFNSILQDGGGIYTSVGGDAATTGCVISGNIVINGIGAIAGTTSGEQAHGIYLDDYCKNFEVYGNTSANNRGRGIFLHNSTYINLHDNTTFKNIGEFLLSSYALNQTNSGNNLINNNKFVSASTSYGVAEYDYTFDNWTAIGTFNNNYYARPLANTTPLMIKTPTISWVNYTVANWAVLSGQDTNSKNSSQAITTINDFQFEYNATNTIKTVSLSQPLIDVKGTKYSGNITLQPFTSLVLMKDFTPVIVPGAPTSPMATAGNASASVTFVAPASNGGSVITGYTVTSIPAGGIDADAGSTSLTHSITGLTNGTSYTFTVKATNSAGSSVASVASNSVTPNAPVATSFLFVGPSSGNVNSASANFTVTPNNPYTGTITITPSGVGSAGLSATVLTFTSSSTAKTFTITPTISGSITLTPSNNGSLTNAANITYTANAVVPGAPTSIVASAGNASASITFLAPTSIGGSVITGYTVTSIPAGGIDANAGSTSLTHTITGLTNGTSYTFTVKATNSTGSSVASVVSNSVTPVEVVVIKQGDIIPSHFTTVWQGLNGLNHMNIIVASATLEDLPLAVDDEIAVFSGSACVGTAKLTKSIVPTDNTSFLTILASQSDGSNNGFIENDTILFKVWDNKNQVEKQINGAVYRNDVATWKTTGRYIPSSTAMVEITSYQVYTQSIELLKGYNMISTYVSVQNPDASAVTKTLVDEGNLVKMQDETGNSFENWGDFGGWINQLGALEKTEGYKIQVANNCTLQVTGRTIAMPLDISLKTGWNIISYPRTDLVNAINVVQALIDQNKLVKVQDEAGNSIENWGLFGGWKNGIGNFVPGKAYKVKMSADAILTFQASYPKSALVIAKTEQTEYYHSTTEGNGTDHMNINITGLNSIGISVGDELAAFDGEICVATIKITEANLQSGSASLVSSFSTKDQNLNGFKVGDPIQILAWSKLSGNESKVNTEVLNGQMKYEKNASVLIKMKSATIATGIANLDDAIKIDVFPNPSQGQVTVRFSEIPETNSRIEISDISGRKLISRLVSGTSEEFNLDSFTPGLYLVRSILGSSEFIQKLIVK